MTRARAVAIALVVAGCAPAPEPVVPARVEVAPRSEQPAPPALPAASAASAAQPRDEEARRKVREMVARVSRVRGLPVRREVASKVLDREQILARIREHVEKEIPRDVVENEGELLAALELCPPDYDFVEGTYRLIQGRIAGFYEPTDQTMYLVDDLGDDEAAETLAHELDHALQDQTFGLGKLLDFAPGDGDRTAAVHAVAEGDALSAQLDVTFGSAFDISETNLRRLFMLSNAVSETSDKTPHALQESLIAPYVDGFAFVQRLRQKGGWPAVDAAWRALPESTEQLLHEDKYLAREKPIAVKVPPFTTLTTLAPGMRAVTDDVMGEESLLIMLAEWVNGARARQGAAGWGGDRYVVLRGDDPKAPDRHTVAVGVRLVFDSDRDARELADILGERFGVPCRERPLLGPITWRRRGRDVVVAAGPYARQGALPKSAGTCATAQRWADEMLKSP